MLKIPSIPAVVLASIVGYLGVYYLYIYSQLKHNREYLPFAATCICIAAYDIFCAGLYSASSVAEGIMWQRFQLAVMALVGICFIQFVYEYTSYPRRKIHYTFYGYLWNSNRHLI